MLNIQLANTSNAIPFKLLELADPSRKHILDYLSSGSCYIAKTNGNTIRAMVLHEITSTIMEIKNIAVDEMH